MPSQDATHPGLSRRALISSGATAGLALTALGAAGGTAAAAAAPAGGSPAAAGSVIVHVRDARSGDIELFSGTTQTRVRDRELARLIMRNVR